MDYYYSSCQEQERVPDGSPIPLCLTNFAHASTPLRDGGVLAGICQLLSHTLTECTWFAQYQIPPYHCWTSQDLAVSKFAYRAVKSTNAILPFALKRLIHSSSNSCGNNNNNNTSGAPHVYCRRAAIYLKPRPTPGMSNGQLEFETFDEELPYLENWKTRPDGPVLAMISLHYLCQEQLTAGEMDGQEIEDIPACLLFQATVEYKTILTPPSSLVGKNKAHLIQTAEALHMSRFGGSRDDGIKYGALAALDDRVAAYALDIYSVRGKRYRFDLMGTTQTVSSSSSSSSSSPSSVTTTSATTISNPTFVPNDQRNNIYNKKKVRMENNNENNAGAAAAAADPSSGGGGGGGGSTNVIKTLCVTIDQRFDEDMADIDGGSSGSHRHPIVKMEFTMGGKPRHYSRSNNNNNDWMNHLPSFHYIPNGIADTFLRLNPHPPQMVTASPSGHTLILDPTYAGRIYVNGQYCTTWGKNVTLASHGVALFGMDLLNVPVDSFGTIQDFELVKVHYAHLWHEILIDARLVDLQLARRLLFRLLTGTDPSTTMAHGDGYDDDDDGDVGLYDCEYDDDDDVDEDDNNDTPTKTLEECLESMVLSAPIYDRVGIAPKALATRFALEFGPDAFPCQAHEVEWARKTLPHRNPIVVPLRLITILRRGGYFDVQKTADLLWFTESRPLRKGLEIDVAEIAVQQLEASGCSDVDGDNIVVFSSHVANNVITKDTVCRWNASTEQFVVHEDFFSIPIQEYTTADHSSQDDPIAIKGYLLGMYIAKVHPNGRILARYVLRGGVA